MNTQTRFIIRGMIPIAVVTLLSTSMSAQQPEQPLSTEVRHIGTAEAKTLIKTGFFPSRQPEVYWHDQDWNIDLAFPPSPKGPYSLRIRSSAGSASIVKLPDLYTQIDSISRTPNDDAIIVAEINGKVSAFGIVDLKLGKVIDDIAVSPPSISPSGRFILYLNTDYVSYYNYRLYDILKTPLANTCGYRENDPKHKDLDETYRGFPVYPRKANQVSCSDADDMAFEKEDHVAASDFVWAADSDKIVFADVKSGVMSLVLVTMPVGAKDLPKTSIYALTGAEDVCAGATDAAGDKNCDYHLIQSLGWEGDAVNVVFHHRFGTNLDLERTIPVSKFVPIGE